MLTTFLLGLQFPSKNITKFKTTAMSKLSYTTFFILCAISLIYTTCTSEEEEPAFIYVEPFNIVGTSNNIKYAELVLDDAEFIGAYPVPGLIPIVGHNGFRTTIKLSAGIQENGISSTPQVYPFYTSHEEQIRLEAGKIDTISPVISYKSTVAFSGNIEFVLDLDGNPNTKIINGNLCDEDSPFGTNSITLNSVDSVILAASYEISGLRNADNNNPAAFIEMDYLTDMTFQVGLIGVMDTIESNPVFPFGVNPNSEWNKIYFNITPDLVNTGFEDFRIAIFAKIPNDMEEGLICLRRMSIVHFKP